MSAEETQPDAAEPTESQPAGSSSRSEGPEIDPGHDQDAEPPATEGTEERVHDL